MEKQQIYKPIQNLYSVFMIDPPYPKKKGGLRKSRPNQYRALDYDTMSMDEIFALLETNIFSVAMPEHAVFMWTIDQFLIETEQRMESLGYKRHCRFIWDKTNGVAPAFTVRYSHEYLIWFYKPSMIKIEFDARGKFTTVFTEKAREHSRKPEFAYDMIEKLYYDYVNNFLTVARFAEYHNISVKLANLIIDKCRLSRHNARRLKHGFEKIVNLRNRG